MVVASTFFLSFCLLPEVKRESEFIDLDNRFVCRYTVYVRECAGERMGKI